MQNYNKLEAIFNEIGIICEISGILGWDNNVMLPQGAVEIRAEQLAFLQRTAQEKILSFEVADLIMAAEQENAGLDFKQQANIRKIKRSLNQAKSTPTELLTAITMAASKSEMLWREARAKNDFKIVQSALAETLKLTQEVAQAKAEYFGLLAYDALLDGNDPYRRSADVDIIFKELLDFLPSFVEDVIQKQPSAPSITGHFPIEKQKALGTFYMRALGLDVKHSRLDESVHPFCGGHVGDTRITTRYEENEFLHALMGIIHETGHALYQNNLAGKWQRQPVGSHNGMSIHESQSLFVEMQIGRSFEFMQNLSQQLPLYFDALNADINAKSLYANCTQVKRSFIRVEADEVTYPLHVILRYTLEKEMLSGNLTIADLPGAWNELMKKFLNIVPKSDSEGCLQDIHWYMGAFGYFPCYTLGAMTAAQLKATLKNEIPSYQTHVKNGELKFITDWLKDKIHVHGMTYSPEDLLINATGKKLSAKFFIDHLKERYSFAG